MKRRADFEGIGFAAINLETEFLVEFPGYGVRFVAPPTEVEAHPVSGEP